PATQRPNTAHLLSDRDSAPRSFSSRLHAQRHASAARGFPSVGCKHLLAASGCGGLLSILLLELLDLLRDTPRMSYFTVCFLGVLHRPNVGWCDKRRLLDKSD